MGRKHTKVQLTGFAAGNAVGDKLSMFVIGKSKRCQCFSAVRHLLCRYQSQEKLDR